MKNNRKWGLLLMFIFVISGTAILMAVYPWLKGQAFTNGISVTNLTDAQLDYDGYYTVIGDQAYVFSDYWRYHENIMWLLFGAIAVTAPFAFFTGLIKPLRVSESKFFAMPFEILLLIGGLAVSIFADGSDLIPDIVWYTVIGEFETDLMDQFYLNSGQAQAILMILNVLMWAFLLFFIYWFSASLSTVFTLGFGRWLKERTVLGRLAVWGKRTVDKTCVLIQSVDFRSEPTKLILKIVGVNFILLTLISCFWFFGIFGLIIYSIVLFFLLRRIYDGMQEKYRVLLLAAGKMAEGNLDVDIDENLGVFEPLKGEITKIRNGFKKAVDEEVKSQSMKTELITNVSHDLKTPLTAIITYVNLLKKEDVTEEERKGYIEILDQKSMRLKLLIEDLFEISKANSRNVTLNLMEIDIVSLMKQVRLELEDKIARSQIEFRFRLPEEKVLLELDSDKTYRIFENLLVNIVKYSLPGTRAYVEITETEDTVEVSMKNISATEISLEGKDITDRFVRGDQSRNTEGSGLGLAIARSFVELQKGKMDVEVDADLFKVRIQWKKSIPSTEDPSAATEQPEEDRPDTTEKMPEEIYGDAQEEANL